MYMPTRDKSWVDVSSSLLGEEYLKNPYPVYEKLRSLGRVVRIEESDSQIWIFSHYDDVADIQKDRRFLSRRTPELLRLIPREYHHEFKYMADFLDMLVVSHDGEKHTRLRKVMNHGFTTYALNKLKTEIQESVDMLIEKFEGKKEMDFVKEFAHPFPSIVIMKILGVDLEDLEKFMAWSDVILAMIGSIRNADIDYARNAQDTLKQMMDSFISLIALRKSDPRDDLISHMLSAKSDDGGQLMSDIELAAQCCLLIINGNETTRNLLSSTLMLLFTHREQKGKLDSNPELLESVIEEVLRFESPVQFIRRIAAEDLEYQGAPIRKGDSVVLLLGSSHRDSSRYVHPESFDVTRKDNKHMAFGAGAHYCVGASLSRLETQIALSSLFERFPNLDLADANDEWKWNMNPAFRGLLELNVKF
jgi:cytochrome P450